MNPEELIEQLGLVPHPEGGFFRETYRADLAIPAAVLPFAYSGPRSTGTAIYYLLKDGDFSAMHRVRGEEMYHFYLGDPVEMLQLRSDGTGETIVLGQDIRAGMQLQVLVPAGVWQGSRLKPGGTFALFGTTMSPGFDFEDFELGEREKLLERFPDFRERILERTPD